LSADQIVQITEGGRYKVSVSKPCCPVCWALIDIINEAGNPKNIQFEVRAHHSTLYVVDLPPWLPASIQDKLISAFARKLGRELDQAIGGYRSFRPTHKSKGETRSFESIASALTVSTEGGSAGCESMNKETDTYHTPS
jgi:hypothetical protein